MAMQVKHMLTVGLGLGVAAAFSYHFLSGRPHGDVSENAGQLAPLSRFEHAPKLPAILGSTPSLDSVPSLNSVPSLGSIPIPAQPQVDTQFRSEATPLRSSTFNQAATVKANTSYQELAAAAQSALPAGVCI